MPDSALVRQLSTAELFTGHCIALVSPQLSAADAVGMASPPGLGDYSISGLASCEGALLDVSIIGDKAQLVRFSWKGAAPG